MTYEMDGIKVNCVYLKDQLQVRPHETLLSMDLSLNGDNVVVKPHYDTIVRVRRITGYLSTLPRFNDAKKAEVADRVCHLH